MIRRPRPSSWRHRLPELWCWMVVALCAYQFLRALLYGVWPNLPMVP